MDWHPCFIEATDLGEAWVRCMWHVIEHGRAYFIQTGSRAGMHRIVNDALVVSIKHPESRPFYPLAQAGQVIPIDENAVNEYFVNYVYSPEPPAPNEHYKYSEFIYPLANRIIDYYVEKGFGNAHATIRVGNPFCFLDYFEPHKTEAERKTTPCLLDIDTRIIDEHLCFYVYYRSWDLFSGYPLNNAGFQLLKEFMCHEITDRSGRMVRPGGTLTVCKDLHLYSEDLPAAVAWTNHEIELVKGIHRI